MFILPKEEWESLRTQIASLKIIGRGQHTKYMPFVFTEHGVTMLSSVLNSDNAIDMNVAIVRAFISLKQLTINQQGETTQLQEIKERLGEHDVQLSQIYDAIENLLDEKTEQRNWENRKRIGFAKQEDTL